ncbi:type III secretion system (T3SS) inner membrane Yop/YscD-like protein [Thiogranum longum]|uniref:Type III secretion system (T3SS) inner membrane Yop/YscD-like protein n=1 Tax=Thiogranum longum TaxID=1537524 RepID=A0A4V2PH09_9GAMM|nr:PilZ domain-containing protein [Thiogranum longum]TCK18936.1 type III secretion system (T3SS) inner membrane Yop/YscD-like protein [Thiogranum longum]
MARLTLSFKGQKLKIFILDETETVIGRDSNCAIFIDSLAIDPQHAIVRQQADACTIEPVADEAAVFVNDTQIEAAHELSAGDAIQVGKHTLTFSREPVAASESEPAPAPEQTRPFSDGHNWLQIQSGAHLGRTIRLDKAFTRIGSADSNLAIIACRNNGHYLSHLNGEQRPTVNDQEIDETARKLCSGDRICVGELQVQFFSDPDRTSQEDGNVNSKDHHADQRKFSRIPFDVCISLHREDKSWESTLADISLHGALIHTPEDFNAAEDIQYQLNIHLEGGPDIIMDVHVAHQESGTIGLRCDDIDLDSITHLRRLIELNLGDMALLERELSALAPAEPA